jgi:hypothetical protein
MKMKLKLTALAIGTLSLLAASTASFTTAALASDDRPTYGECASPPPNPKACETEYDVR